MNRRNRTSLLASGSGLAPRRPAHKRRRETAPAGCPSQNYRRQTILTRPAGAVVIVKVRTTSGALGSVAATHRERPLAVQQRSISYLAAFVIAKIRRKSRHMAIRHTVLLFRSGVTLTLALGIGTVSALGNHGQAREHCRLTIPRGKLGPLGRCTLTASEGIASPRRPECASYMAEGYRYVRRSTGRTGFLPDTE